MKTISNQINCCNNKVINSYCTIIVLFSNNITLIRIKFLTWNTSGAKSCYLRIIKHEIMLHTFNYDSSFNFLSCL